MMDHNVDDHATADRLHRPSFQYLKTVDHRLHRRFAEVALGDFNEEIIDACCTCLCGNRQSGQCAPARYPMEHDAYRSGPVIFLTRFKALPWPEQVTVVALFAAGISLIFFGAIVSAICLLLVAAMGWTRAVVENAAKGKPTLGNKGRLFFGGLWATLAVVMFPKGTEMAPKSVDSAAAVSAIVQCDFGSRKTEAAYVASQDADLRIAPKKDAAIVPWEIGNDKVAFPMEEGNTVREHCRVGQWSKIHTPTVPDVRRVYGWVPSSALRKVKTTADGRRAYEEADFEWPNGSAGQRTAAVKIMNRIMDQRRECEALDHENLVLNKTTKGKIFSIPCFTSGEMLSFDFVAADAINGRSFVKVDPMDKYDAIEACKNAVLERAKHPSTVEFPTLDYDFRSGGDGEAQVLMSATAKNAFNLELSFDVQCDFNGTKLDNFAMSEAH